VALDALLGAAFATRTVEDWLETLRRHRVPAAPPAGLDAALAQARCRGQLAALPPGVYGSPETVAVPWLLDGARPLPRRPPPALGEHTVEVLAKSGLEAAAIRALLDAGVAFAS
jgi:crotonobetainyl-CoA:carnitine CoA-transferase CaiB-like acyl-CoA transferase